MLTDRQLLILQVIVDDFIQFAQPVGSRSLAKKPEISLSSATIRNEMAGLLKKHIHHQVEFRLKKVIDTMSIIYYPHRS